MAHQRRSVYLLRNMSSFVGSLFILKPESPLISMIGEEEKKKLLISCLPSQFLSPFNMNRNRERNAPTSFIHHLSLNRATNEIWVATTLPPSTNPRPHHPLTIPPRKPLCATGFPITLAHSSPRSLCRACLRPRCSM